MEPVFRRLANKAARANTAARTNHVKMPHSAQCQKTKPKIVRKHNKNSLLNKCIVKYCENKGKFNLLIWKILT